MARPSNNLPKCSDLENQAENLTAGLNAYDLFRTTYGGNGGSQKQKQSVTSRRLLESKRNSLGESLVGDEIK